MDCHRVWSTLAGIAGWPRTIFGQGHAHILDTPYGHGDVRRLDILTRQRSLNFTPGSRLLYVNSGTFVTDMPFVVADGHGGVLTTVDDLLTWNANLDRPIVGDGALTGALETRATFGDGRTHEYALGLVVDTYKGVKEVDHSGGAQGYRAHLVRYPDQRVSIAVLCNVATANPTAYTKALADVLLRDSFKAPPPARAPSIAPTGEDVEGFAGLYKRAPAPGALAIVRDRLGLSIDGGARLVPVSRTRFVTSDGSRTFEFDGRNRFRAVDEFGTIEVFDRVEPAAPRSDQLQAFTGRYSADEIEARLDVVIAGDRLAITRRPDTSVPLTPVYADAFASPLGFIVFQRNATGRVTGFSLTQSAVWNLRFDRLDGPSRP